VIFDAFLNKSRFLHFGKLYKKLEWLGGLKIN